MSRQINNILNEEFEKSANHLILKEPTKISLDYVPESLPGREKELSKLAFLFKDIIVSLNTKELQSTLVFVTGEEKTGKTVTLKRFGTDLEKFIRSKQFETKINFYYKHINCIRYRTFYSIFISIIQSFIPEFPIRGFSTFELVKYLKEYLEISNSYLLLTLDDISSLNNDKDYESVLMSLLINETENQNDFKKRVSLVLISKSKSRFELNNSIISRELGYNVVHFEEYSNEQLFKILFQRASDTLFPNSWNEDDIRNIITLVQIQNFNHFDPRLGLEILWRTSRNSEQNGKTKIDINAYESPEFESLGDSLIELNLKIQEKVILFIIAEILLKNPDQHFTRIKEIKKIFDQKKYDLNIPFSTLGHTSIFNYLQELKKLKLIVTEVGNAQKKGRTTIIKLIVPPAQVEILLRSQLVKNLE